MNQEDLLATRYGIKPRNPQRSRIAIISGAVIALVLFVSWAIAVTAENSGRPTGNLLSFSVESDSLVVVEISAKLNGERSVVCQVEALAQDYEVIGYKEVVVEKGRNVVKTDVTTVEPAVSAVVKDCWFK